MKHSESNHQHIPCIVTAVMLILPLTRRFRGYYQFRKRIEQHNTVDKCSNYGNQNNNDKINFRFSNCRNGCRPCSYR